MTEKMFCSQCGMLIDDDSKFCSECGAEVIKNYILSQTNECEKDIGLKSRKIVKVFFIVCLICLLFISVGSIGYLGFRKWRIENYVELNKSEFICSMCNKERKGQKYRSNIYTHELVCEQCVLEQYPNSWQVYYKKVR